MFLQKNILTLILTIFLYSSLFSQNKIYIFNENNIVAEIKIYDSTEIEAKLTAFVKNLQQKGFVLAAIDTLKLENDTLKAFLNKGDMFHFGKIDFENSNEQTALNFSKLNNKPANLFALNKLIEAALVDLNNNGFPFANVYFNDLSFSNNLINAKIIIDSGNYVVFDSIFFDKKIKISEKFMQNYLQCQKNKPYNNQTFKDFDRKIKMLESVEFMRPSEIEFHKNTADVYLYLSNKKTNSLSGLLGFTNANGKFELVGEAKVKFVNTFKINDEFALNWQNAGNMSQNLDVYASLPYIFGTKLGIANNFTIDKIDTSYVNITNKSNFQYFVSAMSNINMFADFSQSVVLDSTSLLNSFSKYFYGLGFKNNAIDDLLSPTKGYTIDFWFGVGMRKNDEQNDRQMQGSVNFSFYKKLAKNFVFNFSTFNYVLNGDSLQENELYRFGGASLMRGFDEKSLSASQLSANSAEIRYLFGQRSYFFAFADYGIIWHNIVNNQYWLHLFSFGTGVQLQTKAGLLKLTYAIGESERQAFDLRNSKLHILFVSVF